jgi:adenylosuccinate synthase
VTSLALTKLDVLDHLPTLSICTGYRYKGDILRHMPSEIRVLEQVEPCYEELPGWLQSTVGLTELASFPDAAKRYIDALETAVDCDMSIISTGHGRDHAVLRATIF